MSISEQLRALAGPTWDKILVHPFVTGLCQGSLPPEKFSYYLLQDYSYLLDSLRVFCQLAARSSDERVLKELIDIISLEMAGEISAYENFISRLGLTLEDAREIKPFEVSLKYREFQFDAASARPFPEGLAVVLPCYWSYLEIARHYREQLETNPEPLYRDWMGAYLTDEYSDLVDRLSRLLDLVSSDYPLPKLEQVFLTASRYELSYWDAVWQH